MCCPCCQPTYKTMTTIPSHRSAAFVLAVSPLTFGADKPQLENTVRFLEASTDLTVWTEIPADRLDNLTKTVQDSLASPSGFLACDAQGNIFTSEYGSRSFKSDLTPPANSYDRRAFAAEEKFSRLENGFQSPPKPRVSTNGKDWTELFLQDGPLVRDIVHNSNPARAFVRDTKTDAHRLALVSEFTSATAPVVVAQTAAPVNPKEAALAPPQRSQPGAAVGLAPSFADTNFKWPVPAGASPSPRVPQGAVRLVFDPAVEREAQALAGRLRGLGLDVRPEARELARTEILSPVLAMPAARGADLGVFLWHAVPNQAVAVHREPGVPNDELRLHAPAEPFSFASGEVWILAHPSRVEEALRLHATLQKLGGPQAMVDIGVSWRGVIATNLPRNEVLAPDPDGRGLAWLRKTAGLGALGDVRPLALPARLNIAPDLVIVLRGEATAAPCGLTAEQLALLGRDDRHQILFQNGQWQKIDVATIVGHSLALWTHSLPPAVAAPTAPVPNPAAARIAAVVALLETFDRQMLATRDRVAMATAAAELVTALEPKMPAEKFDPFFDGAFKYVGSFCGFRGLAQYVSALPPVLREDLLAMMKPEFRALLDKALLAVAAKRFDDPALQEGETRLPAPKPLLVEPMRNDSFHTAIARERLAAGDGGGALDLMLCYQNGRGTPYDMELSHFYRIITDAIFPEVAQKIRAGQMTPMEADLKRGSAMALTDHATPLFNAAKFKDEAKTKEAIEMLARAMKGGDKRAAQVIEDFKAEHEKNKQALIAQIRADTVGPKGYMKSDVERKAEEIAKAVREGRFSDLFQAGKPSAQFGNRTLWDLLSDTFGTPEQKLGVGYLTPRVEELAKEINPILKDRKLVFFGKEVFDATDPSKAEELMNRVLAQAAAPFQEQLRDALEKITQQNRPVKMSEAIIAAQQTEALRLLRVAERGEWRSIPRGKTAADVLTGNTFDALFGLSTVSGITAQSLEPLPAFTQGQIEGALHLIMGAQGFQINGPITVAYEHSSWRLQLSGERLVRAAERGKYGKIERPAEMDGKLNFTLNFKNDGTLYLVWAFHTGKNGQSRNLCSDIKKPNGDTYSQTFIFVPEK